ncbi:hypothetical protein [Trichothermofontia sp.]
MSTDSLVQTVQKGFRTTLGAMNAIAESIQDPVKREETLKRLQTDFGQLTEEWAAKGEATEREARAFVESLFHLDSQPPADPMRDLATPTSPSPEPPAVPEIERELQEFTAQLAAMRLALQQGNIQANA